MVTQVEVVVLVALRPEDVLCGLISRQHIGGIVFCSRYVYSHDQKAVKNQRHLSRCITMRSLEEPLLTCDCHIGIQLTSLPIKGPKQHNLGQLEQVPWPLWYLYSTHRAIRIETSVCRIELHSPMTQRHLSGCNNRGCSHWKCLGAD